MNTLIQSVISCDCFYVGMFLSAILLLPIVLLVAVILTKRS